MARSSGAAGRDSTEEPPAAPRPHGKDPVQPGSSAPAGRNGGTIQPGSSAPAGGNGGANQPGPSAPAGNPRPKAPMSSRLSVLVEKSMSDEERYRVNFGLLSDIQEQLTTRRNIYFDELDGILKLLPKFSPDEYDYHQSYAFLLTLLDTNKLALLLDTLVLSPVTDVTEAPDDNLNPEVQSAAQPNVNPGAQLNVNPGPEGSRGIRQRRVQRDGGLGGMRGMRGGASGRGRGRGGGFPSNEQPEGYDDNIEHEGEDDEEEEGRGAGGGGGFPNNDQPEGYDDNIEHEGEEGEEGEEEEGEMAAAIGGGRGGGRGGGVAGRGAGRGGRSAGQDDNAEQSGQSFPDHGQPEGGSGGGGEDFPNMDSPEGNDDNNGHEGEELEGEGAGGHPVPEYHGFQVHNLTRQDSFEKLGDHPLDPLSECVLMHETSSGLSDNVPNWILRVTTDYGFASDHLVKLEFTSDDAPGWHKTIYRCSDQGGNEYPWQVVRYIQDRPKRLDPMVEAVKALRAKMNELTIQERAGLTQIIELINQKYPAVVDT